MMKRKSENRPEYYATVARAMYCTPANFDHEEGDPCVVLAVAKGKDIEQMAFPIDDARLIVAKMLVALATYDDKFADKLLDEQFAFDGDGQFVWPKALS